jgi:hypothetical protein
MRAKTRSRTTPDQLGAQLLGESLAISPSGVRWRTAYRRDALTWQVHMTAQLRVFDGGHAILINDWKAGGKLQRLLSEALRSYSLLDEGVSVAKGQMTIHICLQTYPGLISLSPLLQSLTGNRFVLGHQLWQTA